MALAPSLGIPLCERSIEVNVLFFSRAWQALHGTRTAYLILERSIEVSLVFFQAR